MNRYSIHKFGGSSLFNAEQFNVVRELLSGSNEVIIISALQGTTNQLQLSLDKAKSGLDYRSELKQVAEKHFHLLEELNIPNLKPVLDNDLLLIQDLLHVVVRTGAYSKEMHDILLGFGELWSAQMMQAFLNQKNWVHYLDAASVLMIEEREGIICVNWSKSKELLQQKLAQVSFNQLVIPGFIAGTETGRRTILGRNGSDFSAAIFANLFEAKSLTLWKDVEGIYNADPKRIDSAFLIDSMSYKEALELAYFGAKVLHPMTIAPLVEKEIALFIKNIHNPEAQGSFISAHSDSTQIVKGISSIDNLAVFTIEGTGLISVSLLSARVCATLQKEKIAILLMTQASSEHSLCIGIHHEDGLKAERALRLELDKEIVYQQIERINSDSDCALLTLVGEGMKGKIGVAEKLTAALARAKINIHALSQGSSERSLSVIIQKACLNRALQVIHASFYLSPNTLSVGLIGPGLVGKSLLQQIQGMLLQLKTHYQINLRVRGIMNSKKMLLGSSLDLNAWEENLDQQGRVAHLDQFVAHIADDYFPHAVILDCTANAEVAGQYGNFFEKGIHVVTPNKHANAGDFLYYQKLKNKSGRNPYYFYEATVCAGLPVINTLQDLIKTGDQILAIEGVISGTLSYLFNQMALGKTFSEAVLQAKAQGFTEPDPREDLCGKDVARKLVCLAREWGHSVHMEDVAIQSLIPEALLDCSLEIFLNRLHEFDEAFAPKLQKAFGRKERLQYVGSINDAGKMQIGIQSLPINHPFAQLNGADNMIIFKTKRYNERPLIIQGPGAGAEVTAAGIFADLLRLVSVIA